MSNNPSFSVIYTNTQMLICNHAGDSHIIDRDDPRYDQIKLLLNKSDHEGALALASRQKHINFCQDSGIKFQGVACAYNNIQLPECVLTLIRNYVDGGGDKEVFQRFLDRCMLNPQQECMRDMLAFVAINKMPITEDGCFLAYRKVRSDYSSIHPNPDGTNNFNRVGDIVSMDRSECQLDRNITCSRGLHFASLDYMDQYGTAPGDRIMIVKIDPCDVVSIPIDYHVAKGRCHKYEVIAEHHKGCVIDNELFINAEEEAVLIEKGKQSAKKTANHGDAKVVVGKKDVDNIQFKKVRYRRKSTGRFVKREEAMNELNAIKRPRTSDGKFAKVTKEWMDAVSNCDIEVIYY